MSQLFTNNAITTLAAGISAIATELTVAPGKGDNFPIVVGGSTDFFVITLENAAGAREFIRVDVRGAASDTLGSVTYPLQRGYWSTTAAAWLLGDTVDLRWTAESMQGLLTPSQDIIPTQNNFFDIGSGALRYKDAFLSGALDVTGNIAVGGTVDARDVGVDGAKLDTITWTGAAIKALYEGEPSAFTDAQFTKLAGIATGANLYVHPNHTGDVTSVADGAQTLAAAAITGKTALASGLLDADEFLISDAGVLKRMAASVYADYFRARANTFTGIQTLEGYNETAASYTVTTGTKTLDTSAASFFYPTGAMTGVAYTFAFSNSPTAGNVRSFLLEINNGAAATSITWPTSVDWNGGVAPFLSAGIDYLSFFTRDAGVTWMGFVAGQDMK